MAIGFSPADPYISLGAERAKLIRIAASNAPANPRPKDMEIQRVERRLMVGKRFLDPALVEYFAQEGQSAFQISRPFHLAAGIGEGGFELARKVGIVSTGEPRGWGLGQLRHSLEKRRFLTD